jgi:hypothetical protein
MDYFKKRDILKRYNSLRDRPQLVYSLSALMVLSGLLLLYWFITPRLNSYLTSAPKAYLAQNFKPNIRYVLAKSDVVTGTATPSGYVKVILKEPKIVLRAKADTKGTWMVKIPEKMPEKNYQMQIISFDTKGKNPRVKQVKMKVEPNNIVYQSKLYKDFQKLSKQIFSKT